jgi:hypothetical protein
MMKFYSPKTMIVLIFLFTVACGNSPENLPTTKVTNSSDQSEQTLVTKIVEQTVEIPVTVVVEQTIEVPVTVIVEQTVVANPAIAPTIIVPTQSMVSTPWPSSSTAPNFVNLQVGNSPLIPQSILFDGNFLWVGGQDRDIVVKIDPATGSIVNIIPLAKYGVGVPDIAFDGKYIWALVHQSVNKIRATDGEIVGTYYFDFDDAGFTPQSILFANESIWVGGTYRDLLIKLNPDSGEISQVIQLGKFGVGVPDLVSNRTDIFAPVNEALIQVDGTTGEINNTFYYDFDSTPFRPQSLAFDGQRVWAGGQDRDLVVGININTDAMQVLQVGKTGTGVPKIVIHQNYLWAIFLDYLVKIDLTNISIVNQIPFIPNPISFVSAGEFMWVGVGPQGILIKN